MDHSKKGTDEKTVYPSFVLYQAETRSVTIPDGYGGEATCVYDVYRDNACPGVDRVVMDAFVFEEMAHQIGELRLLKPPAVVEVP